METAKPTQIEKQQAGIRVLLTRRSLRHLDVAWTYMNARAFIQVEVVETIWDVAAHKPGANAMLVMCAQDMDMADGGLPTRIDASGFRAVVMCRPETTTVLTGKRDRLIVPPGHADSQIVGLIRQIALTPRLFPASSSTRSTPLRRVNADRPAARMVA